MEIDDLYDRLFLSKPAYDSVTCETCGQFVSMDGHYTDPLMFDLLGYVYCGWRCWARSSNQD